VGRRAHRLHVGLELRHLARVEMAGQDAGRLGGRGGRPHRVQQGRRVRHAAGVERLDEPAQLGPPAFQLRGGRLHLGQVVADQPGRVDPGVEADGDRLQAKAQVAQGQDLVQPHRSAPVYSR
jgi:hypothetical protein